jgi:5'-nucleotidase / UDP-sugar diphosphatase
VQGFRLLKSLRKSGRIVLCGLALIVLLLTSASRGYCLQTTIRVLHVNDFHGFAMPQKSLDAGDALGGASYLAWEVARLRTGQPTLLLSAGDMIQGDNWANLFQGNSVIELMNLMGFDAMVLGNHEFDFGVPRLRHLISRAKFPFLAANVAGLPPLRPFIIKDLAGVRIAIIGVVTDETPITTHPHNVAGLKFGSPGAALKKCLQELQGRADLYLVLSHVGYPEDRVLAAEIPGIDVIVGGHSHTRLAAPVKVGQTIITQAWEKGKALGVLDLQVENGKIQGFSGHLEDINPQAGKEDARVRELIARYRGKADAVLNRVVATAAVDLDGRLVRIAETNLGNLVADVMRQETGADAAVINGGAIRASIPKGKVRVRDIYTALPFDIYLLAVRLTGAQLRQVLENGVSRVESAEGRFPQVSGLAFSYNPAAPAGTRVKEVTVGGNPLDPEKSYVVATNDFVAAGGDGYTTFAAAVKGVKQGGDLRVSPQTGNVVYSDAGEWVRDLLIRRLQGQKNIAPRVEGRIGIK